MEGFTPTFFLQLLLVIGSAGAVYGAIKTDLKNMHYRLTEEREAAKHHREETATNFHEVRGAIHEHHGRLARVEGANDLAERVVSALKTR